MEKPVVEVVAVVEEVRVDRAEEIIMSNTESSRERSFILFSVHLF